MGAGRPGLLLILFAESLQDTAGRRRYTPNRSPRLLPLRHAFPALFMKTAFVLLLSACLLAACTRPLAVFHWSPEEAARARRKGYGIPTHNLLTRVMCMDKRCRGRQEWKNRQQQRKFKGYKNNGPVKKEEKKPDFSNQ